MHLREVLRIDPSAADGHNNLGVALFKQGKTEEAMGHFRTAIRLCPDFAAPYDHIAVGLLTDGQTAAAASYIRMAESLRKAGVRRCSGR